MPDNCGHLFANKKKVINNRWNWIRRKQFKRVYRHIIIVQEFHQYGPLEQKQNQTVCCQTNTDKVSRTLHNGYKTNFIFTSSGILSRVLISWTSVRTILQAELLDIINIVHKFRNWPNKNRMRIKSGTSFHQSYLIWLGVISAVELHLNVPPSFLFPERLIFIETSWLSEFE